MSKVITAIYANHLTAQHVVHDLVNGDILSRHDITVEALDPSAPHDETRVRVWTMGKRFKHVKKIMESYRPIQLAQARE